MNREAGDMDGETLSRTIETIYDAAVSSDSWPVALDQLRKLFDCNRAFFVDRNLATMQGNAIGMDDPSRAEYFSVWRERNIYNTRTQTWRTGEIITGQQIVPPADLLRSDYYNGFLKPRDSYSLLRISLRVENHFHQSISLSRPRSAEEFRKSDVELASKLFPHLQRAALITRRLQASGMTSAAVFELLEDNPTGIVLLSCSGDVIFANRAVRRMAELADSFMLRRSRIEALRQGDDAALQRLIEGATGQLHDPGVARGGPLRLPRKSGLRDYVVMVAPLSVASDAFDRPEIKACILITDPEATSKRPRSMLRQIYGMTASEALVAERLIAGESPEEVATALAIKVATVRVHLAALFRKTQTRRQSELVRVLLSLPWSDGQAKR
jgi:DNA-binding CsgD family transcriptional regulator